MDETPEGPTVSELLEGATHVRMPSGRVVQISEVQLAPPGSIGVLVDCYMLKLKHQGGPLEERQVKWRWMFELLDFCKESRLEDVRDVTDAHAKAWLGRLPGPERLSASRHLGALRLWDAEVRDGGPSPERRPRPRRGPMPAPALPVLPTPGPGLQFSSAQEVIQAFTLGLISQEAASGLLLGAGGAAVPALPSPGPMSRPVDHRGICPRGSTGADQLEDAYLRYQDHLEGAGRSPSSIKTVSYWVREFTTFLSERGVQDLERLVDGDVAAWRGHAGARFTRATTLRDAFSAIRGFLRWGDRGELADVLGVPEVERSRLPDIDRALSRGRTAITAEGEQLEAGDRSSQLRAMVDDYLRWHIRKGHAMGTVRSYRYCMDGWAGWLEGEGVSEASAITARLLERWQDGLRASGLSPSSRSIACSAVRGFITWAGTRRKACDPMLATVVLQVKTPPRTPRPIPAAELDVLQAALRPRPRGGFALLRDRAMFFFFLSTAARANEALQVDRESYRPGGTYVRQKGGSQKLLILTEFAAQAVQDYLDARTDNHAALWITVDTNRPLRRLEAAGVREAWVRLAKRLGVTRFVTHQLRHTCATEMLDAGVDALVVADHLGHHQLKTISNYAQVRPGRREGAMRALDEHLADRAAANPKVSPAALQTKRRRRRVAPPEA